MCEDAVETRFRTECGRIFARPHHDPRLRENGCLVRDGAGRFLCAATVEETRILIESLVVENGLYIRSVA